MLSIVPIVAIYCNFLTESKKKDSHNQIYKEEDVKTMFCFRDNLYEHIIFLTTKVIWDCDTWIYQLHNVHFLTWVLQKQVLKQIFEPK